MINHTTYTARQINMGNILEKQNELRDQVAQFVNEKIGPHGVINIHEQFLPEEGLLLITVWFRQIASEKGEDKLLPEEMSAELLDWKIHQVNRDALDLLADDQLVRGPG